MPSYGLLLTGTLFLCCLVGVSLLFAMLHEIRVHVMRKSIAARPTVEWACLIMTF